MPKIAKIKPGIYEHYKGKRYEVMGVAHHSETLEAVVVYKALYETKWGKTSWWVRPFTMFTSQVLVDGKSVPRFRYVRRKITSKN